jgi:hypothetical protein
VDESTALSSKIPDIVLYRIRSTLVKKKLTLPPEGWKHPIFLNKKAGPPAAGLL